MSYRCEICRAVSPHRQGRIVHVVTRQVPAVRLGPPTYAEALYAKRGGKEAPKHATPAVREETAAEIAVCHSCKLMLDGGASLASLVRQHAKAVAKLHPVN